MEYKFIKYKNIYDNETEYFALEKGAMRKLIEGIDFIEVTQDFKSSKFIRIDSIKPCGSIVRTF